MELPAHYSDEHGRNEWRSAIVLASSAEPHLIGAMNTGIARNLPRVFATLALLRAWLAASARATVSIRTAHPPGKPASLVTAGMPNGFSGSAGQDPPLPARRCLASPQHHELGAHPGPIPWRIMVVLC